MRGGCYCGYVVYEVSPPFSEETNCHCSICRRTSGAPFVAWLTAEAAMFRLVEGKPTQFRSSSHATRTFCPRCGTQLTFASDRTPEQVDVTIASLSDADSVPPKDHTWMASCLSWTRQLPTLPCHQCTTPPEDVDT